MLILWYLKSFFQSFKIDPFSKIVQITSKHAQKQHIKNNQKNSFTGIIFKSKNCENGQKRGKFDVF